MNESDWLNALHVGGEVVVERGDEVETTVIERETKKWFYTSNGLAIRKSDGQVSVKTGLMLPWCRWRVVFAAKPKVEPESDSSM